MGPRRWHENDDDLLAELGNALAPVRDEEARLRAAGVAAFIWRSVDEELEQLSLSYDSSESPMAFRGPADADSRRMLVFESEELTLELEVGGDVLMGQLVPARADSIVLENPQGPVSETRADEAGFFLLRRPPAGTVRLRVDGEPGLVTEWLPL